MPKPLAYKSQVAGVLKAVVTMLETQTGVTVQRMRSDRGGEFVNRELAHYFAGKGIVHETTVGYAPQSNGAAERLNRTLLERMRGMLKTSGADLSLWAEAIVTASYLRNRSPASATLT
jgi:transposase InsO family protein